MITAQGWGKAFSYLPLVGLSESDMVENSRPEKSSLEFLLICSSNLISSMPQPETGPRAKSIRLALDESYYAYTKGYFKINTKPRRQNYHLKKKS